MPNGHMAMTWDRGIEKKKFLAGDPRIEGEEPLNNCYILWFNIVCNQL